MYPLQFRSPDRCDFVLSERHCVNLITALRAIHHSFSIHWWSLQFVFCVDDGSCPFSVVCLLLRWGLLSWVLPFADWYDVDPLYFSVCVGFCPCVVLNTASTRILVGCLTGFTVQWLPRRRLGGCSVFRILIGDVLLAPTFHWSCILLACFGNYSLTLGYLIPALRVWFQRLDGWRDVFVSFWWSTFGIHWYLEVCIPQFGFLFVLFRVPTRLRNEWWYPIPCANLITALWVILIRFGEDRFRFFTAFIFFLVRCSCRVCSAGFSWVFSIPDTLVLFWWLCHPHCL